MSMTHADQGLTHAERAAKFCQDEARVDWHSKALWMLREKRDRAAGSLPEWEQLRTLGSEIKLHTLSNLGQYLEKFEKNCLANGIQVH
ncbi:MAG: 4Fe-4S ferredoxin, partial [Shewanella sp.]